MHFGAREEHDVILVGLCYFDGFEKCHVVISLKSLIYYVKESGISIEFSGAHLINGLQK